MSDLELVLRFFALSHYDQMNMKYKDYLGDFMDRRNKEYVENQSLEKEDRQVFIRAVENCWIVFGAAVFRKTAQSKKSVPLADAVMIALSAYPHNVVQEKADRIRAAISHLLENNEEFLKAFGTGTNGKGAISKRIQVAQKAVEAAVTK